MSRLGSTEGREYGWLTMAASKLKAGAAIAIAAFALVFASSASAHADWVHWQGKYYACWIPTKQWQVTESANSLNISSPTGIATVGFAYADNAPSAYTLPGVRATILSPSTGLRSVHLLKQGRKFRSGGGGIGQTTSFTALRVSDNVVVRGLITVEVFNSGSGGHAFAVYLQGAPKSQWSQWASTLAIVQKRIVAGG